MVYNCRLYDITLDIKRMAFLNRVKYIRKKRASAVNNIEASCCQNIVLYYFIFYYMDQRFHGYGYNEDHQSGMKGLLHILRDKN